jgi:hypothetical protein
MAERNNACMQNFSQRHKKRRSLGRPNHMWEDNIKVDLKEIWQEFRFSSTGLI